ncbi:trypsin-like serine peptidase [Herbidospora mongoliensis]|uniref:trypsin-like serine peptidase n=1 Tax=Herbidospora mongoliensis TaxID=688067 RepID=UPI00082D94C5|nr:trypsin-like peptidase domain-containing protein [Herbidospora mongoliensis]
MQGSAPRRLTRLAPLVTVPIVAALLPATAAPAVAQGAEPKPVVVAAADSKSEQRAVENFWTEAKMEAAKPLDAPSASAQRFASGAAAFLDLPDAKPASVKPTLTADAAAGDSAAASATSDGSPWNGGGAIERTSGRVFFTVASGKNASCSGNAVTSANKSVVITAGHCVRLAGAFHKNWAFVPGYDNGKRPYGTWVATSLLTTPQWSRSEDMNHDVAAAVVAPLDGEYLTDVVGGQGIAFNQPRGRQMYAFGFPAAAPYNGSRLTYCSGRVFDDFLLSEDIGLDCDMTGGSSGGPWFSNFNEKTGAGLLNSVNSFKYNFASFWMFGPYFGGEAQALYNTAQRTSLT